MHIMTKKDRKLFGKLSKMHRLKTISPENLQVLENMLDTMTLEQIRIFGHHDMYREELLMRDFWSREPIDEHVMDTMWAETVKLNIKAFGG